MTGGLKIDYLKKILILSINRPQRRNAIDLKLTQELALTLKKAESDDRVNVVILRGCSPGFGAGSDLKVLAGQTVPEMLEDESVMASLSRTLSQYAKPTVAAVDGFAIGGGAIYAACCDVVFTSQEAIWALPEVRIGWNVAYGVSVMKSRLGSITSRHILWGVDRFNGITAHQMKLADFLAQDSASKAALDYAERLSDLPTHAVCATKKLVAGQGVQNAEHLDHLAMQFFATCLETSVAQQTLKKFGMKTTS